MAMNVFNRKDAQGQRQRRNGQHEGWVVSGSQTDKVIEKENEDVSGSKCWSCTIKANKVPIISISAKENAVSPCSRSMIISCLILRTMVKLLNFALPNYHLQVF